VFFVCLLTEKVDVLDVLALRFLISFFVFWILKSFKILKINVGIKDVFKKNEKSVYVRSLILTAFFEPVLYMFFETIGIANTTNITAAVVLSLAPVSTCICERVFLKEKATLMQYFLLAMGMVGVIYITLKTKTGTGEDSLFGILCLIGAMVSGSMFLVFSRKSSKCFNAMEVTYFSAMLGMVAFNGVNVVRHILRGDILSYFTPYFDMDNIIGFIYLSIICTIVATALNNFSVSKAKISSLSAFGGVSMLTTITVGVIFGGEKLYMYHIIGITLILIRMFGVSYLRIREENKQKAVAKNDNKQ